MVVGAVPEEKPLKGAEIDFNMSEDNAVNEEEDDDDDGGTFFDSLVCRVFRRKLYIDQLKWGMPMNARN